MAIARHGSAAVSLEVINDRDPGGRKDEEEIQSPCEFVPYHLCWSLSVGNAPVGRSFSIDVD